jgi:hypothetical protein
MGANHKMDLSPLGVQQSLSRANAFENPCCISDREKDDEVDGPVLAGNLA